MPRIADQLQKHAPEGAGPAVARPSRTSQRRPQMPERKAMPDRPAKREDQSKLPLTERYCFRVPLAAEFLSIGRSTLYKLVASGEIESFQMHGCTLIRRDVLMAVADKYSGRA